MRTIRVRPQPLRTKRKGCLNRGNKHWGTVFRCHDLESWSFTLAATNDHFLLQDATTLSRGVSRWRLLSLPSSRCHDLESWSFTLAATVTTFFKMPRP